MNLVFITVNPVKKPIIDLKNLLKEKIELWMILICRFVGFMDIPGLMLICHIFCNVGDTLHDIVWLLCINELNYK